MENVFHVCMAWYKHDGWWENLRQLYKPETKKVSGLHNCREFFPPLECKNKITFPRKHTKLFVMALIKREILTSCKVKVLYTKSCMSIKSVLVLQKDAFQNTDFSHLKCQLKRKKNWYSLFVKIFQVSASEGSEWVNKVNLLSFELKNFFKFVLMWLTHEKQNILVTSQPCLHTLM